MGSKRNKKVSVSGQGVSVSGQVYGVPGKRDRSPKREGLNLFYARQYITREVRRDDIGAAVQKICPETDTLKKKGGATVFQTEQDNHRCGPATSASSTFTACNTASVAKYKASSACSASVQPPSGSWRRLPPAGA